MRRYVLFASALTVFLACLAVAPARADDGSVYVVRAGDTLIGIAARYGLSATELAAANGLRWDAWVYVGQRLRIPGQVAAPAAPTAGGTYLVGRGDTLTRIAARHGVTVQQLAAANGLGTNAWVYAGQRLQIPGQAANALAPTASGGIYIVRPGDTLIRVALRHGVTVQQLAMANGLHANAWVYVGQRLKIPGQASAGSAPSAAPAGGSYVVRPGDTLIGIAVRHGVAVNQLAAANGLGTNAWVYVGQRLTLPGQASGPPAAASPPPTQQEASGSKWIDVNLSTQTLTAYAGQTAVLQTRVSTGTSRTPTVVGTYRVYAKYASTRMSGPGYDRPNVPHVMFFYRGYSIHGTYWHDNFGTPMSHGCVNMSLADAKWLYEWAPMGTKVVTHY